MNILREWGAETRAPSRDTLGVFLSLSLSQKRHARIGRASDAGEERARSRALGTYRYVECFRWNFDTVWSRDECLEAE